MVRQRFGVAHIEIDPWGNLIVTPASDPHERAVDRSRKLADYRVGGAEAYLLVDLPGLTRAERPEADLHHFASPAGSGTRRVGLVDLAVGDLNATLDLDGLIPRS